MDGFFALAPAGHIAHAHGSAFPSLDRRRYDFPAQGDFHSVVHIADVDTQAGGLGSIHVDFQISLASDRFGHYVGRSGNVFDDRGDGLRGLDDVLQPASQNANPHRRAHPRGQHVHAVLNGHGPDIGPAGHLHDPVQLSFKSSQVRPTGAPKQKSTSKSPALFIQQRIERRDRIDLDEGHRMVGFVGLTRRMMVGRRLVSQALSFLPGGEKARFLQRYPVKQLVQNQPRIDGSGPVKKFAIELMNVALP